ncbi:hypothetical protein AXF42_Ash006253 [Apostasia shenzhenica]|uniref:Uncharacterized protein n=1 Tax=Apostasia shenzhenica TaxID=1088818 RepID=A0A2I0AYK0_9ASPA|nr:hypothetical protein AXF42_Ash006253 [Apostasia shenzhenica]
MRERCGRSFVCCRKDPSFVGSCKFEHVVSSHLKKEQTDLENLSIDQLCGSLQVHEERIITKAKTNENRTGFCKQNSLFTTKGKHGKGKIFQCVESVRVRLVGHSGVIKESVDQIFSSIRKDIRASVQRVYLWKEGTE